MLATFGEGDSTMVLSTDPLYWELIYIENSDIFEHPGTLTERAIKYKVYLLPDSVPPANR